jgi:hypothetical protein
VLKGSLYFVPPIVRIFSAHPRKTCKDKLEKHRAGAEDCGLISKLATDKAKQAIFAKLAEQSSQLAADVEAVLAAKFKQREQ